MGNDEIGGMPIARKRKTKRADGNEMSGQSTNTRDMDKCPTAQSRATLGRDCLPTPRAPRYLLFPQVSR